MYPKHYEWLGAVGLLPRMIQEALKLVGTHEVAGSGNNLTIMDWADEAGVSTVYTADSVPWCGLFMAVVAKRAGYWPPEGPLWALNWSKFGEVGGQPNLGDVLTFTREGGGHVGLYIAEDRDAYHVLGGNTSDSVSIARILKRRLHSCRAPIYRIGPPASARPYIVSPDGAQVSINEA